MLSDTQTLLALTSMASKKALEPPAAEVGNFVEITVPLYSEDDFRYHFGMRRSTFQVGTG